MIIVWNIFWGGYQGITLWPFIILKTKELKADKRVINHERIHMRQQLEMLVIFFYIVYLIELLFKGYWKVSFEKEAYSNDDNLEYIKKRKFWAFLKYM